MSRNSIIPCVFVHFADGESVWVPEADYRQNPPAGSYIVSDHRARRES